MIPQPGISPEHHVGHQTEGTPKQSLLKSERVLLSFYSCFTMLEIEPRASHMQSKDSGAAAWPFMYLFGDLVNAWLQVEILICSASNLL